MSFLDYDYGDYSLNYSFWNSTLDLYTDGLLEQVELLQKATIFRKIFHVIDIYVMPFVIVIGIFGNTLSFIVFVCTYMRRHSSSIYLAALAIADVGFLLCVLVSWASNLTLDLYHKNGWCQTFVYLTYISSFLSVWYVVSFTVERYISVHFPLHRQTLCTTQRAKFVVVGLAVFAGIIYSYATWTTGVTKIKARPFCGPLSRHMSFFIVVENMDTLITLIVPFVAILVMNIKIAYKVSAFYRQRKGLVLENSSYSSRHISCKSYTSNLFSKTQNTYTRTQVRVTKMLLTVSSLFLLLNLPRHIGRTYSMVISITSPKEHTHSAQYIMWEKVFQFMYYLHFSVNIFLYSAFGQNFRKALTLLGRRIKHSFAERIGRSVCRRFRKNVYSPNQTAIILRDFGADSRYV